MQFNSYLFILVFLPIAVIGYFSLNKLNFFAGKVFLILMSLFFYSYAGWKLSLALGASVLCNYAFILLLKQNKARGFILGFSIVFNVGLLVFFKYYNFLVTNLNPLFSTNLPLKALILPLGISFFTFQQIAYVVKVYKKEIVCVSFVDYLLYILYFPKLVMRPIVEPDFCSNSLMIKAERKLILTASRAEFVCSLMACSKK